MNLRLLATPLLATGLLLSTLGCSKKEEPTPDPIGTGSYKLDGVLRTCEVRVFDDAPKVVTSSSLYYNYMEVQLTTVPQPQNGAQDLVLYFYKKAAEPDNYYRLFYVKLYENNVHVASFSSDGATFSTAASGFSCVFSAKLIPIGSYLAITNGVFTNAHHESGSVNRFSLF
jgi:hypothetical protein